MKYHSSGGGSIYSASRPAPGLLASKSPPSAATPVDFSYFSPVPDSVDFSWTGRTTPPGPGMGLGAVVEARPVLGLWVSRPDGLWVSVLGLWVSRPTDLWVSALGL